MGHVTSGRRYAPLSAGGYSGHDSERITGMSVILGRLARSASVRSPQDKSAPVLWRASNRVNPHCAKWNQEIVHVPRVDSYDSWPRPVRGEIADRDTSTQRPRTETGPLGGLRQGLELPPSTELCWLGLLHISLSPRFAGGVSEQPSRLRKRQDTCRRLGYSPTGPGADIIAD